MPSKRLIPKSVNGTIMVEVFIRKSVNGESIRDVFASAGKKCISYHEASLPTGVNGAIGIPIAVLSVLYNAA